MKEEGEEERYTIFVYQMGLIMTYYGGDSNSPHSTNQESNFLEGIQKELQESVFKPNSTLFSNLCLKLHDLVS
jgi:hypothetical protein